MCIQFANNTLSVDAVRSMDSTKIGSKRPVLLFKRLASQRRRDSSFQATRLLRDRTTLIGPRTMS